MKHLLPLLLLAAAAQAPAQPPGPEVPPAVTLSLHAPPKFSDLMVANLRLLNPDNRFRGGRQVLTSLESGPATVKLLLGDGDTGDLATDLVHVDFLRQDLAEPGRHYPPAHPVTAETRVRSVSFATKVAAEELAGTAGKITATLNADAGKLDAWIEHELWEETKGLTLEGAIPGGKASVYVAKASDGAGFRVAVALRWDYEDAPAPGRGTRERRVPLRPPPPPEP